MTALIIDLTTYRARLQRAGIKPMPGMSPFWPAASALWLMWALAWGWPVLIGEGER